MKTTLLYIATLALALSSCMQEESLTEIDETNGTALQIVSTTLQTNAGAVTRATVSKPLNTEGDKVYLSIVNAPGVSGYKARYNEPYTYTSGTWTPSKPFYVAPRKVDIYAYYDPHSVTGFAGTATAVSTQDYAENKLWYYDNTNTGINESNAAISLLMQCAYSRLSLTLSRDKKYALPCKISKVSMQPSSGTFYTSADVDIQTGLLSGSTSSGYSVDTSGKPMNTSGIAIGSKDESIDLLFPAQKLASGSGLTFTLTVDGTDYSVTVPATGFNEFKRGVRHTVHLQMSAEELVISSVYIETWHESETNGMPDIQTVRPIKVAESDINLCDNADDAAALSKLSWASGNLKSTGTDGTSRNYRWADSQSDYGYYYTWNCYYTGDGSIEYGKGDPCALLSPAIYGSGWRTPNENDFELLSRCAEKKLGIYEGVEGKWYMNNPNGLFLPKAGYGYDGNSTTVDSAGTRAGYWSSTPGRFYNFVDATGGLLGTFSRDTAAPIRCVKGPE